MKFLVNWKPAAQDELAAAWVAADSAGRRAIRVASHAIDTRLANDPQTAGESRPRKRRIIFALPLAVIFQVHEADRRVDVLTVQLLPRR